MTFRCLRRLFGRGPSKRKRAVTKTALIIRHVPYEGVAGYRMPIEAAGYDVDRIDVTDPAFAALDLREPDLLIMMGGPMGIYEQDRHPWIACQMRRLALRLDAARPTLGVCFGAQMIAAAMGAEVFAGPHKEVGFHSISVHDNAIDGPLRHIAGVPVPIGTATSSPCPPMSSCSHPAISMPTRRSGAAAISWRSSSMPRWGWTRASMPGSNSGRNR